ncbi:hypothetical protein PPOP_0326 [Paenibacillus popilliae ATCC 14706]|uniref:Uncharacterized protein n=1 Tax=Paenibacillus popilliae ATCC 14706 TaxID=1212764 RepID=M9LLJ4_PAEPP|nr:hypothetical protein PPOP_0326 [Paenibacillus popilliae ATCC 14706]
MLAGQISVEDIRQSRQQPDAECGEPLTEEEQSQKDGDKNESNYGQHIRKIQTQALQSPPYYSSSNPLYMPAMKMKTAQAQAQNRLHRH